jgi:hypothetical protein
MGGLVLVCMILAAAFYWRHRLSVAGPSGRELVRRQITFVGDAHMPTISPDATLLAYVTMQPGSEQKLMIQALSGGPSLELIHGQTLFNPRWSPDGSELMLAVAKDRLNLRSCLFFLALVGTRGE